MRCLLKCDRHGRIRHREFTMASFEILAIDWRFRGVSLWLRIFNFRFGVSETGSTWRRDHARPRPVGEAEPISRSLRTRMLSEQQQTRGDAKQCCATHWFRVTVWARRLINRTLNHGPAASPVAQDESNKSMT